MAIKTPKNRDDQLRFENQKRLCRYPLQGSSILVPQDYLEAAQEDIIVLALIHRGYKIQSVIPGSIEVEPEPEEYKFHKRILPPAVTLNKYRIVSSAAELEETSIKDGKITLKYLNRELEDIQTNQAAIDKVLKMGVWVKI